MVVVERRGWRWRWWWQDMKKQHPPVENLDSEGTKVTHLKPNGHYMGNHDYHIRSRDLLCYPGQDPAPATQVAGAKTIGVQEN